MSQQPFNDRPGEPKQPSPFMPPYAPDQPQQQYPQQQYPQQQYPQQQYSQQQYPQQQYAPPQYPQPSYAPPANYAPPPHPQQQQAPYMQHPFASPVQPPQSYTPGLPMNMTNMAVNVNVQQQGPGFIMRALYFVFIGWWLGLFWLNIGFALCALIVTLPLGLIMLNRLPQIMTLRQPGTSTNVSVASTTIQPGGVAGVGMMQSVNVNVSIGGTQQHSFLLRALYFIFVGCWAGYLWANLAYLLCVTLILLPVGIMMFDRLPMVLTLRKN